MNNNSHIHLNSVIICEQKLKWKLSLSDQSGSLTCEHWLFTVCRLQRRSLRQCGHDLCWPHGVQCCYRHLQCVSLHIWLTPFSSLQSCSSWQTANLQPNSRPAKPTSAHTDGQLQQRLRKSHHRLRLTQAWTGLMWECDSLRPELCPSACIHKQLHNSLSSSLTLFMAHLQQSGPSIAPSLF